MGNVQECEKDLASVLQIYAAQKQALAKIAPSMLETMKDTLKKHTGKDTGDWTTQHVPVLENIFATLAQHNSPEAVQVLRKVFACDCGAYRVLAIRTLGAMSCAAAHKALKRHAGWLSFAPAEEKALARSLLLASPNAGTTPATPAQDSPPAQHDSMSEAADRAFDLAEEIRAFDAREFPLAETLGDLTYDELTVHNGLFNCAKNLDRAAEALGAGQDYRGDPISPAQIAAGMEKMCQVHSDKAGLRCGTNMLAGKRLGEFLERIRLLASNIRHLG